MPMNDNANSTKPNRPSHLSPPSSAKNSDDMTRPGAKRMVQCRNKPTYSMVRIYSMGLCRASMPAGVLTPLATASKINLRPDEARRG